MSDLVVSAIIPGQPVPKGRARSMISKRGGMIHYTPQKTRDYEALVAACVRSEMNKQGVKGPIKGPVGVELTCLFLNTAKSKPGTMHTKKPDIDNVAKSILDGLVAGGLLADDARICSLFCVKKWVPIGNLQPCVIVDVFVITQE